VCSAGARLFKVGGPTLKLGGPEFLLILALENNAVHNVVTSIYNSFMQSEIWYYKFRIAFPGALL